MHRSCLPTSSFRLWKPALMGAQSTEKTPLQVEVREETQVPSSQRQATEPQGTTLHQSPTIRTSEFSKRKLFVSIWLPLFGHLALSIAITLLVALGVNGYHALAYSEQKRTQVNGSYVFRVSDITTLLSAGTKIMDNIGAMWTGLVGWRCGLVLPEYRGLEISQLSEALGGWPLFKLPRGRDWLVALIFAFILPRTSSSPSSQGVDRKTALRQAGGMASIAWGATDSAYSKGGSISAPGGLACRHLMPTTALVNSTLANATLPCIYIHNITWPDDQPPDDVWEYAWSKADDLSTFGDSLFAYVRPGVAVAFSQETWASNSTVKTDRKKGTSNFAEASKWSRNMTVLLLLGRQTSGLPGVFQANTNAYDENSLESVYIAPRVVEYHIYTQTISASREAEIVKAIKPSIWTKDSLWVMPDAMAQIAVMNTSMLPTWENLNNYTATLIRYAYMSNWDMFHASFEDTDTASLTLRPAEPRLQASVSFERLFSWFAITLLLPLTGVIFKFLHRSCDREVIADPVATLFKDASRVIENHRDLTTISYITEEHKGIEPIRLRGFRGPLHDLINCADYVSYYSRQQVLEGHRNGYVDFLSLSPNHPNPPTFLECKMGNISNDDAEVQRGPLGPSSCFFSPGLCRSCKVLDLPIAGSLCNSKQESSHTTHQTTTWTSQKEFIITSLPYVSAVTEKVHMSDSPCHLNPRYRRRHRIDPDREGTDKDYGAHKQTWSERFTVFGCILIQIASLRQPILGPPRRRPPPDRKYRHDHDRHRRGRTRTPSRGRHKSLHRLQIDRSYSSNRRKALSDSETDLSGRQEDKVSQSTTASPPQAATTDHGDAFPKPMNADAPLSSVALCPRDDLQTEGAIDVDIARETRSEQREKSSLIAPVSSSASVDSIESVNSIASVESIHFIDSIDSIDSDNSVDSVDSVDSINSVDSTVSSLTQGNECQPKVSSDHGTLEAESLDSPHSSSPTTLPAFLYPGSIVRRKVQGDLHPHTILHIEQEENKTPIIWTCICKSRPRLWKIRQQYGNANKVKRHFIYFGGIEPNKGFETDGNEMPTVPEVEIQGPPMPKCTYLELSSCQAFDPGDFKLFSGGPRHLKPSSLDKVINELSQTDTKHTWLQKQKKSPPGSVPVAQPEILMKESSRKNLRPVRNITPA
ncbi:hypothetical protein FCOIX_2660 [Fusarium coicis]|nr:hypothetical protein FCOIX_2660 [Fusarium coicis]